MGFHLFVKQLAFRTSAMLFIKVIGSTAKIPLFRILGAEGVGLYEMAYAFYVLLLTTVTGGLPTTLTLTTAKNMTQGLRMLKFTLVYLSLVGGMAVYFSYTYANKIALFFGDSHLTIAIRYISPALVIVPLLTAVRSFLQGIEYYGSIAISEIIEQIIRVLTMVGLTYLWIERGNHFAVGGATFGAFTGGVLSLFFLLAIMNYHSIRFIKRGAIPTPKTSLTHDLKLFVTTSLVLTATRFILPLLNFFDSFIVPHRLQDAGYSVSTATSMFGEIYGMAGTVVYLPTMMTSALCFVLAAKIVDDWKNKKIRKFSHQSRLAIQLGWLWGSCATLFLFLFPHEIAILLFGSANESIASIIRYLAPIPIVAGIREITTTILWATDNKKDPIIALILGSSASIIISYFLIGIPGFGYQGAALAMLTLEIVAVLWNTKKIRENSRQSIAYAPSLLETFYLIPLAFISFFFIHLTFQVLYLPQYISIISEMILFNGTMSLYILYRFLKINQLRLFL